MSLRAGPMMLRRGVALLNLALFGGAVVAELLYPAYASWIFYGLLLWMLVSFVYFYRPTRDRSLGGGRGYAASGAPSPSPLPSGPPTQVGFCVFCGTHLDAAASSCPACLKPAHPI